MDYQTYNILSVAFFVAGGVLFVITVILFFVLHIPFNIGYITNYSQKKEIKKIQQRIMQNNVPVEKDENVSKNTDKAKKEIRKTETASKIEQKNSAVAIANTTKLSKKNFGVKDGHGDSSVVNTFSIKNKNIAFEVLQEFSFTESNEIIE